MYFKLHKLNFNILFMALIALGLRLLLARQGTLTLDQNTFIAWSSIAVEKGFTRFYEGWSDYLPGYIYILWILGKINSLGLINPVILYKLPAILSDIATGALIYSIVKNLKNSRVALIAAAAYVLNPAVLANSTLWGQVDSLTAFFALLAVYFSSFNPVLSGSALAVGTLIKPQAAFVAPVILFFLIRQKQNIQKIATFILAGATIFVLGFLPFAGDKNIVEFVSSRLLQSANQYQYGSVNAFNFWGIFGFWQKESPLSLAMPVISLSIFILTALKIQKEKYAKYALAAVVFLSTFMLMTRMHERHLLPALAPLAAAAAINPALWIPYAAFSVLYVANLYFAWNWVTFSFKDVFSPEILKFFSFANVAFFALTIYLLLKKIKLPKLSLGTKKSQVLKFPDLPAKNTKIILFSILLFALISRIAFLGSPASEYFDEVYHAFTAKVMLRSDPKAWEWWNTPPEGFAYEWTHPPLAKEGMILGMLIFGENSFGWRVPQAFLGVGVVFLIYLIAKKLFKDDWLALLAAAIATLDGLLLAMSRIGMNDTYFLFFALLSFYLFLRDKYFFSAASLGLALASKWSTIWLLPILVITQLSLRKKLSPQLLWFAILPPLVYLGSYIPMFLSNHNWNEFIEVQKQMWWYHTRLVATHAYTSPWWSWPILLRPIYLYTSEEVNGFVSRIYAMGNPGVFWMGIVGVAYSLYEAAIRKNRTLALMVFSYMVFFVPWAASPRIMFLYHYLPSIPFLAIATAYLLRKNTKLIVPFLTISAVLFLYFYPHWVGLNIPLKLDSSYYWFRSWR